jgi:hypothetical protein
MLTAPGADALGNRFASQWLRLQDLEKVVPDPILYPYSDQTLSLALKKEPNCSSTASSATIAACSIC